MNGDSQIVQELPKIFGEIRDDVVKAVGAGVVCYLTYRLVRYVYIRQHGRRVREENKMMQCSVRATDTDHNIMNMK